MKLISYLNIKKDEKGHMTMPFEEQNLNYVGSMHAAAQFALAEFASGDYLQEEFPEYKGQVFGVVRKSQLRYRNPGKGKLTADVSITDSEKEKIIPRLKARGMALAVVNVLLTGEDGKVSLEAVFEWFLSLMKVNEI